MVPFLLAAALPLALQEPAPPAAGEAYRALFDRGVAALDAGESERAVALFRAAGERAPDAPVWKRYLDVAAGLDPRPREVRERLDPPWTTARTAVSSELVLDPTGERLVAGGREANLIDVRSGAVVARLESRLPDARGAWVFDDTGAVVVGLPDDRGRSLGTLGIDVRDARTGRPLELEGAARLVLPSGSRFEWFPSGTAPTQAPPGTEDLSGAEGVLRVHRVEETKGLRALMSPTREHALIWSSSSLGSARLIDRATGEEVVRISPASWPTFGADGEVFMVRGRDELRVFETESGRELGAYELPRHAGVRSTVHAFHGRELMRLDPDGALTAIDLVTREATALAQLDPPPTHLWGGIRFVRGGALLIAFGFEETSCYEVRTGAQRWRSNGGWLGVPTQVEAALDSAESIVVTHDADGAPIALDVNSGERLWGRAPRALSTESMSIVPGQQAVIVAADDGTLRRIELETGATSAWTDEHAATSAAIVRRLGSGDLLTTGAAGRTAVRDPRTLAARASVELGEEAYVLSASARGGRVVSWRGRGTEGMEIVNLSGDDPGTRIPVPKPEGDERWRGVAISPDGTRVALVHRGRVAVIDASTGVTLTEHALFADRDVGHVDFLDDDRLLVGWSGDVMEGAGSGVAVVGVDDGELIATLDKPLQVFCDGAVQQTRHLADVGLLVYSISPSGFVRAYHTKDWSHAWTLSYSGGNWALLDVRHEPGGAFLGVSGMTPSHSRVLEVATGAERAGPVVHGEYQLALTAGDRYLVGLRDGALVVRSGETLEPLYLRHEATDGAAWITRGGRRRPAAGAPAVRDDPSHLIRDGWSAQVDCWDAWLVDPRGIAPFDLSELPTPPEILSGPPREVPAGGDGVELELRVRASRVLIGILVTAEGEAPRFVPLEPSDPNDDGETSLRWTERARGELDLRAVSRRGLMSRPWRVAVR